MEVEQSRPDNPAMTFDEVSMERSKSFIKALQELKNLRPHLYSAAEYCEKSYLHSEQKQMVLDNLKDYAVQALVNAVDHLGTVAYKLTDLLEQQTLDVSTMELKVSCLNQQLLTCQTYTDKEGLRQQQLLAFIPRHHKHYILPNSVNKKVHFSPHIQTDARQSHMQARPRLYPSGTPTSKTLSWHLASETKSTLKGTPRPLMSTEDPKNSGKTSGVFHLLDAEDSNRAKSSVAHLQVPSGGHASNAPIQTFSVVQRDSLEVTKPLTAFRSFDNPTRREMVRAPVRSKSVLSAFFVKQKTSKLKTSSVA
uniref:ABI-1-like 1 n=1 Tax=Davidia involucrata TaxID=16924 RepID=A0A5B7AAK5_DAVIN